MREGRLTNAVVVNAGPIRRVSHFARHWQATTHTLAIKVTWSCPHADASAFDPHFEPMSTASSHPLWRVADKVPITETLEHTEEARSQVLRRLELERFSAGFRAHVSKEPGRCCTTNREAIHHHVRASGRTEGLALTTTNSRYHGRR